MYFEMIMMGQNAAKNIVKLVSKRHPLVFSVDQLNNLLFTYTV